MPGPLHTVSHVVELESLKAQNRRLNDDLYNLEHQLRHLDEHLRFHPHDHHAHHERSDVQYRIDDVRRTIRNNDGRIRDLQRLIDMEAHHHHHHAPPPPPRPMSPPPPPMHGGRGGHTGPVGGMHGGRGHGGPGGHRH